MEKSGKIFCQVCGTPVQRGYRGAEWPGMGGDQRQTGPGLRECLWSCLGRGLNRGGNTGK